MMVSCKIKDKINDIVPDKKVDKKISVKSSESIVGFLKTSYVRISNLFSMSST